MHYALPFWQQRRVWQHGLEKSCLILGKSSELWSAALAYCQNCVAGAEIVFRHRLVRHRMGQSRSILGVCSKLWHAVHYHRQNTIDVGDSNTFGHWYLGHRPRFVSHQRSQRSARSSQKGKTMWDGNCCSVYHHVPWGYLDAAHHGTTAGCEMYKEIGCDINSWQFPPRYTQKKSISKRTSVCAMVQVFQLRKTKHTWL